MRALGDMREEIVRHMTITDDITNDTRGNKKSAIEMEKGESHVSI